MKVQFNIANLLVLLEDKMNEVLNHETPQYD